MARYKQLANKYIEDIQSGKLREGARMPSLRQLTKLHGISMSTAVNCYEKLGTFGWVISRPKAGFFVSACCISHRHPQWSQFESTISEPKTLQARDVRLNGPLGISTSGIEDKTLTELEGCFRRSLKRLGSRIHEYPNPQGEPSLRQVLANYFTQQGFPFTANELVITNGCISSVRMALEVCTKAGDAVAISSPCFSGLLELLSHLSLKIIEIPSLEDGIDLDQLEQHLKKGQVKAGLFCTSHMNPQGITMSNAQKQRLASLANQYKTPIIEDDVYIDLSHSNHFPLPAKYYDTEGYIIWCSSISKSLTPSYRLGWCLPGRYVDQYRTSFTAVHLGVSTLTQLAVAEFIDTGLYARYLRKKRFDLLSQKRAYIDYLQRHLPDHARMSDPVGGLVLWIQVPGLDGMKLTAAARANSLDIRVGTVFTSLPLYRDCFRINMGFPLDDKVRQQLDLLVRLVKSLVGDHDQVMTQMP